MYNAITVRLWGGGIEAVAGVRTMGRYDGSMRNAYLGSSEDQAQREMQPKLKEAAF